MRVTPVVLHVRQYCSLFAGAVSGGIDWESIESSNKLPGLRAHIVLSDEQADQPATENVMLQDVGEQFEVCVEFPQAAGDEEGRLVGDQVDAVRRQLVRALVGWSPDDEYSPIEYVGRQLLLINRAKAVYQFSFATAYRIGRNLPSAPAETWQEYEQDGLPLLAGLDIDVDVIDPMVDRNLAPTGPDGRIEVKTTEDLQT